MKNEKTKETLKKKKFDKVIKCRCTTEEYQTILIYGQNNQCTTSEVMRKLLFTKNNAACSPLEIELLKQSFYNLILSTEMPETSRTMLIKEVERL